MGRSGCESASDSAVSESPAGPNRACRNVLPARGPGLESISHVHEQSRDCRRSHRSIHPTGKSAPRQTGRNQPGRGHRETGGHVPSVAAADCRAGGQPRDAFAGHADDLMALQHNVPRIATTETKKLTLGTGIIGPAKGRRVDALLGQSGDDSLVNEFVDSRRSLREWMARRNAAGVGPLVVMQNRAAAGQPPDDVKPREGRNRSCSVFVLKIAQRDRRGPPAIPANRAFPPIESRFEKRSSVAILRTPLCGSASITTRQVPI